MSLLQRKKAALAAKTNDLSTITWAAMASNLNKAETLVGTNAQIRYGIATETDVGLPVEKFVLIPVLEDIQDPANRAKMYGSFIKMCGIHEIVYQDDSKIDEPYPVDRVFSTYATVERNNRHEIKPIPGDPNDEFKLVVPAQNNAVVPLTYICAHMNYKQFHADYPDLPEGAHILGAHAVAMAYRTGILECFSNREFLFVRVKINQDGSYEILDLDPDYAKRANKVLQVNAVTAANDLKMHDQMMELGLGICIGAGTTHYMMNHTTGGNRLNGHNLKALTVNNLYNINPAHGEVPEERQTEFYYHVTHAVSKRAVANLVLPGSRVSSWWKNAYLPSPSVIYSDTFMAYRQNLMPSGAHKIYMAMLVLRNIVDSSLGVFLPDPELVTKVIKLYADVIGYGARAHVGSRYYTDEPIAVSQAEVDDFLPLAAYYVTHKMATSSLAASPHLSPERAEDAHPQWKAIIDATRREGAFGAPIEQVKAYLVASGSSAYKIDLSTPQGIDAAKAINKLMADELAKVF